MKSATELVVTAIVAAIIVACLGGIYLANMPLTPAVPGVTIHTVK